VGRVSAGIPCRREPRQPPHPAQTKNGVEAVTDPDPGPGPGRGCTARDDRRRRTERPRASRSRSPFAGPGRRVASSVVAIVDYGLTAYRPSPLPEPRFGSSAGAGGTRRRTGPTQRPPISVSNSYSSAIGLP